MDIRPYLTDTVLHKARGAGDGYGGNAYGAGVKVPVRFEEHRALVRNAAGEETVSEARVFSLVKFAVGDKLEHDGREWFVISSATMKDLGGNVTHYEARL